MRPHECGRGKHECLRHVASPTLNRRRPAMAAIAAVLYRQALGARRDQDILHSLRLCVEMWVKPCYS